MDSFHSQLIYYILNYLYKFIAYKNIYHILPYLVQKLALHATNESKIVLFFQYKVYLLYSLLSHFKINLHIVIESKINFFFKILHIFQI